MLLWRRGAVCSIDGTSPICLDQLRGLGFEIDATCHALKRVLGCCRVDAHTYREALNLPIRIVSSHVFSRAIDARRPSLSTTVYAANTVVFP